jgi:hypothetical protein
MWDLQTIVAMNAPNPASTPRTLRIYDIGDGKFALGNKGSKAVYVVRRIANKVDRLGRGLPTYTGVQARKPRIPTTARIVRREDAGRLLLRAFGLR